MAAGDVIIGGVMGRTDRFRVVAGRVELGTAGRVTVDMSDYFQDIQGVLITEELGAPPGLTRGFVTYSTVGNVGSRTQFRVEPWRVTEQANATLIRPTANGTNAWVIVFGTGR